MTPKEIKEKIDFNNKIIRDMFNPNQFTLNNTVRELLEENARLQEKCEHKYSKGYCIYCYKEKK
ncbi:MAG: hypothetical protein IJD46_00945 [Bacilli bacterium]|nr:hypothetical protein [Bacilli bacterium]